MINLNEYAGFIFFTCIAFWVYLYLRLEYYLKTHAFKDTKLGQWITKRQLAREQLRFKKRVLRSNRADARAVYELGQTVQKDFNDLKIRRKQK